MNKLDLYLNDSQYSKLCILAKEENYSEPEEYANELFYNLLLAKWLKHKNKELNQIINDPNTNWEE